MYFLSTVTELGFVVRRTEILIQINKYKKNISVFEIRQWDENCFIMISYSNRFEKIGAVVEFFVNRRFTE